MEDYLQQVHTLRSQMIDFEDQTSKTSAEEQTLVANIEALESEVNAARTETTQLREDLEKRMKTKDLISTQIIDKQRKIITFKSDLSTLDQTLELIHQEKFYLSAKIVERRAFYEKVGADICSKLQQQKDWLDSRNAGRKMEEHGLAKHKSDMDAQMIGTEENIAIDNPLAKENSINETTRDLMSKLDSAKNKLEETIQIKAELALQNAKMKQSIQEVKCRENTFKPELIGMDILILEEEHKALLSDKEGETQYLQSLQDQNEQIKGISHDIKCSCGEEYTVTVCR